MLEHYYRDLNCIAEKRRNCLAGYLDEIADLFHQQERNYQQAHHEISAVAHFGDWLKENGRKIRDVTPGDADLFMAWRYPGLDASTGEESRKKLAVARVPINRVLRMIREKHPVRKRLTSIDKAVAAVAEHLDANHGYAPDTIKLHCKHVRRFLRARFGDNPVRPAAIKPMEVHDYVLKQLDRYHYRTVHHDVCGALRVYFRYLKLHGLDTNLLQLAIPRIRVPRPCLSQIILSDEDLKVLWGAFDLNTPIGRRDYAAILCMTDLGMRVGNVTRLSLDDINWREATITVHSGKRATPQCLPLPYRVGEAIANYLRSGRPGSESRAVFLRHRRPCAQALGTSMLRNALRRAYARTGLNRKYHGAHILRHTAATRMRRARVALKPAGDVLGHQSIQTTILYAQVDLPALQAVARPWPEGAK